MGELAGGMEGEESSAKGQRNSWFSAQTVFSFSNTILQQDICFLDVELEHGTIPEASVNVLWALPSEARPRERPPGPTE